ncbi:MAG: portal protein [Gammaproteobacteria bacterium RIFOXYA12_FULL_61_12]|nr:MAG: portal protein [Gammaproteobacteria bacterium RIFOXYD12_FULL_61_37]OGT92293.1 MAG: portal protein [Gammaproteobacteria bacterium RIFOXYA12_FULL_61_12]
MELHSFIYSAVLLLFVTSLAVTVFRHLGLGSVLGLLIAGIVVGPHSPGPILTPHVEDVRNFTELGVVMLLFLIGLEMKPHRLWAMRREVFGLGSLQVILTGLIIAAYLRGSQPDWSRALLLGLTLALSSTAFVVQLLQERGEIASRHGTVSFAVLLMQDLAIVPLLALVPLLSERGAALGTEIPLWRQTGLAVAVFLAVWVLGSRLVPWLLERLAHQGNREGFFMVVMLALFLSAWLMHEAGFSMALGAFLIGILLSDCRYSLQIQSLVEPYKGLLLSLFFVAVGMSIDLGTLFEQPLLFAQGAVAILLIKLLALFVLGLAFDFPLTVAVRVAFLLAQGGEFGFVLLGTAKALGVIDDATFVLAVGLISITMLATPLMARLGDLLAARLERNKPMELGPQLPAEPDVTPKVIIGGYGRVGHVVAVLLHGSGIPFIVFDNNPAHVRKGHQDGFPVYYGDIGNPDLLAAAHVERASLVVLTVDQGSAALRAVSHLRNGYPHVPVLARARDLEASGRLLQAGATEAYPEAIESSLNLAAHALRIVGTPSDDVDQVLEGARGRNYELVRSRHGLKG